MRRPFLLFLAAALVSCLAYWGIFAVVRKPISVGIYRDLFRAKQSALDRVPVGPRLLLLGGSNVRVSHSARTLGEAIGIPCVNGGMSADLGLGLILHEFKGRLRPGDTVYLPIEYESYAAADADRRMNDYYAVHYAPQFVASLGLRRYLEARFAFDLPFLFSGAGEMLLARAGFRNPGKGELNSVGDQTGYTAARARAFHPQLLAAAWKPPATALVTGDGDGRRALEDFLRWAVAHGITVIGGLPTTFDDRPVPDDVVEALRRFYSDRGAEFLLLPNRSQYPRACFYDSPYHLTEDWQQAHSAALGEALKSRLRTPGVTSSQP